MKLKDYEKEVGRSVAQMTYEQLLMYLEINQDESTKSNLSYGNAYWLGRLFDENRISANEYTHGISVLRSAVANSKRFCRCFVEAEDPTGKEKDHWVFYLRD